MIHQHFPLHNSVTPTPEMSDNEAENRVFETLEAQRQAWDERLEGATDFFPDPGSRIMSQRIKAWWHSRTRSRQPVVSDGNTEVSVEPAWRGHWAVVKFL